MPLLTLPEAANELNISVKNLRAIIRTKAIEIVKLSPRTTRIAPGDLEDFISKRRIKSNE
jgi:hypothetical protein